MISIQSCLSNLNFFKQGLVECQLFGGKSARGCQIMACTHRAKGLEYFSRGKRPPYCALRSRRWRGGKLTNQLLSFASQCFVVCDHRLPQIALGQQHSCQILLRSRNLWIVRPADALEHINSCPGKPTALAMQSCCALALVSVCPN